MKNRAATALGVILGVVAALASTASAGTAAATSAAAAASCSAPALGMSAPADRPGGVPRAGAALLAQFAASKFNKENGTKFSVKRRHQLKAPLARTVGRKFVSDSKISRSSAGPRARP